MKRIFKALFLLCLVFCLLPSYAFASNAAYDLDELGMSIELPDDYVVFTRDIKNNDPNLDAYGLTKDGMTSLMMEQSIYLNAWDEDLNFEIIVTMLDSPFVDYNQFSDTSLSAFISALDTEYAGMGATMIRSEFYQHSQAKFAKLYISQPNNGETAYGLQYHTVYDGKAINITLYSYSGKINSDKEAIIQEIVDSVHFDAAPQFSSAPAKTDAFNYTNPTSGMSFTVPANWVEAPMNEEREFLDAKFVSNLEEGLAIIFSCEDIFELEDFTTELSWIEKIAVSRTLIGNNIFTKADIAEMYGCKESDISMATYGGKEYYSAEITASGTAYGLTLSTPMVVLVRCENGYMYMFQFNGPSDSAYFSDFKDLMASVEYPVIEEDFLSLRRLMGVIFMIFLVVLVVVFILMKRRRKNKKAATASPNYTQTPSVTPAEETYNETVSAPISVPDPIDSAEKADDFSIMFCHKCGCKIEHRSRFCHKCGANLITEEK